MQSLCRGALRVAPAALAGASLAYLVQPHVVLAEGVPSVAMEGRVAPEFLRREWPGSKSANKAALEHVVKRTLEMYDCEMTKESLDILDEEVVFEDVFMRLPGLPMVRAAFDGMKRLFDAQREGVMVDLHTYPSTSCTFSHGDVAAGASSPAIAPSPAVGAASGAGGEASSTPTTVPAPGTVHPTDRAVVMRLQYTYTAFGWKFPYDTVVRLYIRDVGEAGRGPGDAALPDELQWRVVRWEDMLWGHELLSFRNGGFAGGAFALTRRMNGALYYVVHTTLFG